jgi:hypothetical protein
VGQGGYDIGCLLDHAAKLPADTPLLVEHINNQQDYKNSIVYLNILAADRKLV